MRQSQPLPRSYFLGLSENNVHYLLFDFDLDFDSSTDPIVGLGRSRGQGAGSLVKFLGKLLVLKAPPHVNFNHGGHGEHGVGFKTSL